MDPILILIFALAAGDLILLRVVSRERARRRKAERHAGSALRENLKLMDALERRASVRPRQTPVVAPPPPPVPFRTKLSTRLVDQGEAV